jgi:hypothetical protein
MQLLLLVLDGGISVVAFLGSFFSFKALGAFRTDIMEKVFGLTALAFALLGFVSILGAAADWLGTEMEALILFDVALILVTGLITTGLILFVRWANQNTGTNHLAEQR